MRKTNSGITGRALNHGSASFEVTAGFGSQENSQCGAIFDRTAGVHELSLAKDFAAGALAEMLQANQRGVAHRSNKSARDPHPAADCVCAG